MEEGDKLEHDRIYRQLALLGSTSDYGVAATGQSVEQLLRAGSAEVAQAVALFGLGIVVLPLLGRLSGVEGSRCLTYMAHSKGVAEGSCFLDRATLEARLGRLDPQRLVEELTAGEASIAARLAALSDGELRSEVAALEDWHARAHTRLRLLGRRAASAVLGLPAGAGEEAVRQAYKRKALELHPDKGGDADQFAQLREKKDFLLECHFEELSQEVSDDVRAAARGAAASEAAKDAVDAAGSDAGDEQETGDGVDRDGAAVSQEKLDEEFDRFRHEATRQRLHNKVVEKWHRIKQLGEEIRRCEPAASGGDALLKLRKFISSFARAEISKLSVYDAQKAEQVFQLFCEQGYDIMCAAGTIDPVATVACVAMQVNYPLTSIWPSENLKQRCAALLDAIRSLPSSVQEGFAFRRPKECDTGSEPVEEVHSCKEAVAEPPATEGAAEQHAAKAASQAEPELVLQNGREAVVEPLATEGNTEHHTAIAAPDAEPELVAQNAEEAVAEPLGTEGAAEHHAATAAPQAVPELVAQTGKEAAAQPLATEGASEHNGATAAPQAEPQPVTQNRREAVVELPATEGAAEQHAATAVPEAEVFIATHPDADRCTDLCVPRDEPKCQLLRAMPSESPLVSLQDVYREAQEYLEQVRSPTRRQATQFRSDRRAGELAQQCQRAIEMFDEGRASVEQEVGDQVIRDLLLALGELHFRAGAATSAGVAFGLAAEEAGADTPTFRLASIGVAAAAQCAQELGQEVAPSTMSAAAGMVAAVAWHRREFGSLKDANVTRDLKPSSKKALVALVLLHGYGASGEDLVSVGMQFRAACNLPCRLVFPQGLYGLPPRASWRDNRLNRCDPFRWDSVLRTLAQVSAIVAHLGADGIPPERVVLGGFSQGSFMAVLCALTHRPRLGGLLVLGGDVGGRVASFLRTFNGPEGVPQGVPVFLGHGSRDHAVEVARAEEAVEELRSMGLEPELKVYPGVGHAIPEQMIRDMAGSVVKWLGTRH